MATKPAIGQAQQNLSRPLPSPGDAGNKALAETRPESHRLNGGTGITTNKKTIGRDRIRPRGDAAAPLFGPREMIPGSTKTSTGTKKEGDTGRGKPDIVTSSTASLKVAGGDEPAKTAASLTPKQRAAQINRSPTPLLIQGDHRLLRDVDRAPPGDSPTLRSRRKSLLSLSGSKDSKKYKDSNGTSTSVNTNSTNRRNSRILSDSIAIIAAGEYGDLARKRSQYFEDIFSARDGDNNPAKERVRSESLVLAEIRTNVHVADEFTLLTELSAHLAGRYSRPLSSIAVSLQHGQCMCFGGSFEAAYIMSVSALPSQLQPTTNKRNAALLQKHMEELLGVPATRGHLRFVPIPETNLAYGGTTTVGHLDDLARSGSVNGALSGAAAAAHYGTLDASPSTKSAANEAVDVQTQAIGSGLGSRKYKTARKLSVKTISSGFRSPTPSPEKTSAAAPAQGPPPVHVSSNGHPAGSQKQPNTIVTSAATVPSSASTLPVIPERFPKEGRPIEGKDDSHGHQEDGLPQTASTGPAAAEAAVGRQPSHRARRTKSFMAALFGRSATTATNIQEEAP